MAEVPIQISGVLYDKTARTQQSVVLMGKASIIGLTVGGGPIIPPEEGGSPPGIWGPTDPFPTPPIVIPPETPSEPPLVIWGPNDPRPTPPIELPGGGNPPTGGERVKLVEWHTAWTEETGWIIVGTPAEGVPHPTPSKK